ncbi:hypothetical protein EZS27_001248 [termite gut metagenome]|uniref:SF4 helicase domain-containing protein n=1 Tax=termite gut metagenome TaxID=433724 RepID=A0A5J4SZ37_9ZZZZ
MLEKDGTNVPKINLNELGLDINIINPNLLIDKTLELYQNGLPRGLDLGVKCLDELFRFELGRLATITGIPNRGKSEIVDFVLCQFNKLYGYKTAIFSPENQPVALHYSKLVSKYVGKTFDKAVMSESEVKNTLNYLSNNFFIMDYQKNYSLDEILGTAKQLIDSKDTKILVLDSYNKIECQKPDNITETDYISKVLDRLERFSKDNNILILLVAHTTKMPKESETGDYVIPTAYNINGSANFFNKSDFVIVVHRIKNTFETMIKVDKVKFKNLGSTGEVRLQYDIHSGNYYDNNVYEFGTNKPIIPKIEPFVIPSENHNNEPIDYLNIQVDYFDNKADIVPKPKNLKEFITSTEYKTKVEYIRAGSSEKETKERKNKANLPCVCMSGRFNTHRSTSDLKEPTGLICVDIDLQDNRDIMSSVPTILKSISNVAFLAKSVRGIGYYAIIPIKHGDKLINHFWALERDFKSLGITIDRACKDYTRLRLASYDTEYYINSHAEVYNKVLDSEHTEAKKEPKRENKEQTQKTYTHVNDFETVDKILNDCKTNNVDITGSYIEEDKTVVYENWNKIALTLISVYKDTEKGREYFREFSKLSNKYNESDCCNTEYDKMLLYYKDNNRITVASLVYLFDKYSKE